LNPIVRLTQAYNFAALKHVGQRRKGEAAEPYINHLTEVAQLAAEATDGDVDVVIAAILHDTLEDTDTTFEELDAAFGPRIAGIVAEVTDDKSLPKQARKDLQVTHAAHASPAAQVVKLADKTSNLRSMAASPPAGWPPERKREYVTWAQRVVAGCRNASPWLAAQFDAAAAALDAKAESATRGKTSAHFSAGAPG
jgi:(p)ppGpp synthase/HD superfamily hydrolase